MRPKPTLVVTVLLLCCTSIVSAQTWQVATPRETHQIPSSTGTFVDFPTVTLQSGMQYSVHTTGTVRTQDPKSNDFADGHYYYGFIVLPSGTPPFGVSVGLQVRYDATNFDFLQGRAAAAQSSTHSYYDLLSSSGTFLSFRFFDTEEPPGSKPYYTDNTGSLTVEVAQATPQLVVKDSVLDFGDVDFRLPKALPDSIETFGTEGFHVDGFAITGSNDFSVMSARGLSGFTIPEMQSDSLTVIFHPTKLGPQTAILHIYNKNAFFPQDRDRQIVLKGIGHGPIVAAVLDTVHFGTVGIGKTKQKQVHFVNIGDRSTDVAPITFTNLVFYSTDTKTFQPGDTTDVLVSFTPSAQSYYFAKGTLDLDANWNFVNFYVDGNGGVGTATVAPDTIDFGALVIGTTRTKSARISNLGDLPFGVTKVTVGPSEFTTTGNTNSYNLDSSQFSDYPITFAPIAHVPGNVHVGTLTFTFAEGQPSRTVVLIGRDHEAISAHVHIPRTYYAFADSDVTIVQYLDSTLSGALDSIKNFSESVLFNPNVLDLVQVEPGALLPPADWSFGATTTVRGKIDILAGSIGHSLHGPGELFRFHFHVSAKAHPGDTSDFPQTQLTFGTGFEPLMTSSSGLLRIRDACTPIGLQTGHTATSIEQNTPNPFNPQTTIRYYVGGPSTEHVRIRLYNLTGALIATLLDEDRSPGAYQLDLDASQLASGVYTYTFESGQTFTSKRMVLSK